MHKEAADVMRDRMVGLVRGGEERRGRGFSEKWKWCELMERRKEGNFTLASSVRQPVFRSVVSGGYDVRCSA